MYFVLDLETSATIAMCIFEDVAIYIAKTFPTKCIVRFIPDIATGYDKDAKFFKENEKALDKVG